MGKGAFEMRKMKDSGIPWIGEIPESWEAIKFKYLFSIIGGNGFPDSLQGHTEGDFPFCKVSDINGPEDYVDSAVNWISQTVAEDNKFNIIPVGSIVMAKIGAALAKNHRKINSVECCIDNNTQALVPKRDDNIRYLFYVSKCIDMSWFDNGSTVPSINNTKLLNFFVPNVFKKEQTSIADFLDAECARIDAIIEQTRATVEEYKKLKQSIITQAVTKGIRPNRPMKDSGIEWIGEIPEEWDVRKIKNGFSIYSGATPKSEIADNWDGDIVWITPADYKTSDKYVLQGKRNISTIGYESCGTTLVPQGSIVFSKRAPIGTVAIAATDLCTNQGCLTCVPSEDICNRFYYYTISVFTEQFNLLGTGTTFKEISYDTFCSFKVPYAPFPEQCEIADYLDEKIGKIDELIIKKEVFQEKLNSYKKSLIYEYVTGKKEVL